MLHLARQLLGQRVQMFIPLGQHQWRTSLPNGLDQVMADKLIALFIGNQLLIEFVELLSHIGIGRPQRAKVSRTNHDRMLKGMSRRPLSGINPITHGAALHKDDRMVAILPCDRRGQTRDELRLGLTCNQLKALGR